MPSPSHDRSELKQRPQELTRQLADMLLSADSPVKDTAAFQQDWQQHRTLCDRRQSLALLDGKLLDVLPGMEQREREVAEAKKAVAHEVTALRQFAAELGTTAFAAVLSGDVAAAPRFEARRALHERLEALNREMDDLGQAATAKLTEKMKLKAQQLKLAGEIKLRQLKIGSLDRALGESLLDENEEASVDCPQTTEVLKAVTRQRAEIASATEKQNHAQSQLADTMNEAARTLGRESVQGATVLQAELKQVRKDARSIEKSIATAREAIVAKALEDESLRDNEQLGPDLKQLWSIQFDLAANQSQASKMTARLSTLSQPVKYAIYGVGACVLLIVVAVWFGSSDDGGTSLSENNEATEKAPAEKTANNQETLILKGHSDLANANQGTNATASTGLTEKAPVEKTANQLALGDPVVNSVGMVLVPIPPGEFQMGSPASETSREDDEPQHRVRITKPFYLSAYEVTQSQYEQVMGHNPSRYWGANRPVDQVIWNDAVEFCRKLSEKEGVEYRLPTEAEWEYACRAGTTTAYSFGDDASQLGEYARNNDNSRLSHAVGEKLPNAWGLYDMHGNVWEWCQDWYEPYGKETVVIDPTGAASGIGRVLRGGSFDGRPKNVRSANRCADQPANRFSDYGFRLARTYDLSP